MGAFLELIPLLLQLLPAASKVVGAMTLAHETIKAAHEENRALTDAEWDAIHAAREALQQELLEAAKPQQAPLPAQD